MKFTMIRTVLLTALLFLTGCGDGDAPLASASVSPDSGSGGKGTFIVSFTDPKGAQHIKSARVLFNGVIDGRQACYVFVDRAQNAFFLINDNGEGSQKATSEGVENSQCRVEKAELLPTKDDKSVQISLKLAFKPAFKGRKQVFLAVDDAEGHSPDLKAHGTWIVPSR